MSTLALCGPCQEIPDDKWPAPPREEVPHLRLVLDDRRARMGCTSVHVCTTCAAWWLEVDDGYGPDAWQDGRTWKRAEQSALRRDYAGWLPDTAGVGAAFLRWALRLAKPIQVLVELKGSDIP